MAALAEEPRLHVFVYKFTFLNAEGNIMKTTNYDAAVIFPEDGEKGWEALRQGRVALGDYFFSLLNEDVNPDWIRKDEINCVNIGKGTKQDILKKLKDCLSKGNVTENVAPLAIRLASTIRNSMNLLQDTNIYWSEEEINQLSQAAAEEPPVPVPDELMQRVSSGENCGICMEKLEGAEVTELPCGHKLRTGCYNNLMIVREFTDEFGCPQVTKQECPICRTNLITGEPKQEENLQEEKAAAEPEEAKDEDYYCQMKCISLQNRWIGKRNRTTQCRTCRGKSGQ